MTWLDIYYVRGRIMNHIQDLNATLNLVDQIIKQQISGLSGNNTTTTTTTLTTTTTTPTSTTTSTPTTSTTTLTTTIPPSTSGNISGYIGGINSNFLAGSNYTLSFIPINFDINQAQILWESNVSDVFIGPNYNFTPQAGGNYWLQTEANLIDGRRIILDNNIKVNEMVSNYIEIYNPNANSDASIKEWYKLDLSYAESLKNNTVLTMNGNCSFDNTSFIFPNRPSGACLFLNGVSDYVSKQIAPIASATSLSVECMLYLKQFNPNGVGNASIVRLEKGWNAFIAFAQDTWSGPSITCYNGTLVSNANINTVFPLNAWNHVKLTVNKTGYYVHINVALKGSFSAANAIDNFLNSNLQLVIGQEQGYLDEVMIKWS